VPHRAGDVLLVVPTLGRREALLAATLASVTSQRGPVTDLVVVVPPAATAARALAERAGARLVDDPGGLTAAIAAGFATATTQRYLAWLGDDDLLAPGSLAATAAALDADPGAVVAFGYCTYIDGAGRRIATSRAGRLAPWLLPWGPNLLPQPGALFRRDAVEAVGGLDVGLGYAMDLDLLLRLRRRGRLVCVHRPVSAFRWHTESTTVAGRDASIAEHQAVQRRYLPGPARRLAPLVQGPVGAATRMAAGGVARRAARG
jgi:GT2 family glycosyltransferase